MEGKGALTFLLVRIFYVRLRMLDIHIYFDHTIAAHAVFSWESGAGFSPFKLSFKSPHYLSGFLSIHTSTIHTL